MRAAPFLTALAALAGASAAHASSLSLMLNHSARLPTTGPASSVVVGSPSVVDVSVVDSRTVFVSGKTQGSTAVTVIDPLGRVVYHGDIVVGEAPTVRVFRGSTRVDENCTPYCVAATGPGTSDGSFSSIANAATASKAASGSGVGAGSTTAPAAASILTGAH